MTTHTTAVDHPYRRVLIALPEPHDAARSTTKPLFPTLIPRASTKWPPGKPSLKLPTTKAPHAFTRYARRDITALMAPSPSSWEATQYLMGNHTIAERMFRHDPSVMPHALLRALLCADTDGDTKLGVDQPSLPFASYHNPHIAAVGRELDELLISLIELLSGEIHQLDHDTT